MVPGASVQVKGTSQGTITDLDGKFAFNVPNKNSILVISFIGYVTVEMKASTCASTKETENRISPMEESILFLV